MDAFNFLVENNADLSKETKTGQSLLHIGRLKFLQVFVF